jgi:replication factor C subunit 3/5
MVLELNASDERGIAVVREQIKTFAATKSLSSTGVGSPTFKLIVLDECDAMTNAAQSALRRVMEKYVRNVRFVLICNYVGQIIPALQSRCTRFRFSPLPFNALKSRLELAGRNEGLTIEETAKDAIIRLAGGDMRRILNVLQAAAASTNNNVTEDSVYAVTAAPHPTDLDRIFKTLLDQTDYAAALALLRQLQLGKGLALVDIVQAMFDRLGQISIPDEMRLFVIKQLAEIEYHLARGATEAVQLPAVVGTFFAARTFLKAQ